MTKVNQLADKYYKSHDYKNLRDETKSQYKYFMGVLLDGKNVAHSPGQFSIKSTHTEILMNFSIKCKLH